MLNGLARQCPPPEYALPCFRSRIPILSRNLQPYALATDIPKAGVHCLTLQAQLFALRQLHHTTNAFSPHQACVQFFPYTNVQFRFDTFIQVAAFGQSAPKNRSSPEPQGI